MDRNKASELWPIMKAYSEGKTVQMYWEGKWRDFTNDDDVAFYSNDVYRIKPEPSYRPFKDGEECWKEMLLHHPFGWVKWKNGDGKVLHSAITDISPNTMFADAMKKYAFADGAPFGIRIKEDEDDQSEEDWEDDWEEDDGEE